MSNSGSDTPASVSTPVDPNSLSQFIGSQAGSAFQKSYTPGNAYYQQGQKYFAYDPKNFNGGVPGAPGSQDVTDLMTAYQAWMGSNNQQKQSWQNYSEAVAANAGGEGDNTITTGAAVGQRQQLLGALANPNITTPTPGLGSLGAVAKKMGS